MTWIVVILMAAALVVGLWQVEARRRRLAVVDGQRATLAESERTFRLLFERNPVPMWTFDPQTLRFLSVNEAAVAAYGYSRDEFLSMTILDIRPAEDREALLRTELRSIRQLASSSVAHLLKDGRVIDVDVVADQVGTEGASVRLVAARDVTDQRHLEAELRERAFHDSLTGLANRALFADRFEHAQAVSARTQRDVSVVLLDLDGFKVVNDTLSHGVGDELLRHVAHQLSGAVRPQDTVARMGGDEFAVLLEDANMPTTRAVVTRLLAALSEPIDIDGTTVEITASAGVVPVGHSQVTWETALQRADVAMYVAKANGKARFRVYEPGMRNPLLEGLEIAAELQRAIARHELLLHYQPVVSLATGEIVGVEALVRWMHPERGLLSPRDFIGVAEETGLIIPLGAWVLETACRQLRAWDTGLDRGTPLYLSVNVSSRELREPGFVAGVLSVLASTGMSPRQLVLEVTETIVVENMEFACSSLGKLRHAGIRVAMDDFGAGYSSLGYLRGLPLDVVKIDRMFIAGLATSDDDRALTLAIVRLLGTTEAGLIAEGIETEEQLAYVQALGVDWGQGYLFSRPVPPLEIPELLRRPPFEMSRTPERIGVRAAT